jgi:sodium/potassium/calcium exchanger 6
MLAKSYESLFTLHLLTGWAAHLKLICALVAGSIAAILVVAFADEGNDPAARVARTSMGFLVAIVWIMAIADEVVQVLQVCPSSEGSCRNLTRLQTFGFIFGLSDAIIGLTVFAVGNSLADFVANITVAAFAPIMGFSACFGGPMLNILLGVGLSGTYVIRQTGRDYQLTFSTTLFVSSIGLLILLLATVLFVPWNGYMLSRSWGIFLIGSYTVLMTINVITEVRRDMG